MHAFPPPWCNTKYEPVIVNGLGGARDDVASALVLLVFCFWRVAISMGFYFRSTTSKGLVGCFLFQVIFTGHIELNLFQSRCFIFSSHKSIAVPTY